MQTVYPEADENVKLNENVKERRMNFQKNEEFRSFLKEKWEKKLDRCICMRYNPTIKNQTAMKETSTPRFQPERHGRRLRAMRGNPAGGKNTLEPVR